MTVFIITVYTRVANAKRCSVLDDSNKTRNSMNRSLPGCAVFAGHAVGAENEAAAILRTARFDDIIGSHCRKQL